MTRSSIASAGGSVVELALTIDRGEVLHFLGYPEAQHPPERIESLLDEALHDARHLASGRGVWVRLPGERAAELSLEPVDATGLVVGLVTIGDRLESRASELLANGDTTSALLLDAAGSAAVEEAADRLGAIIAGHPLEDESRLAEEQGKRAGHVSCRISPGYGRWPIQAQEHLFELLPHSALHVSLLRSMLMVPRKSISFAMWLGADARPIAGLSGCSRCELERCRYRRVSGTENR
jgi:hypothetical protein